MLGWGMFGWECLFVSGSDMQDLKTRSDWDDLQPMVFPRRLFPETDDTISTEQVRNFPIGK